MSNIQLQLDGGVTSVLDSQLGVCQYEWIYSCEDPPKNCRGRRLRPLLTAATSAFFLTFLSLKFGMFECWNLDFDILEFDYLDFVVWNLKFEFKIWNLKLGF